MIVTNGQEYSHYIRNVIFGKDSTWFEDFKRSLAAVDIAVVGVTVCPASESHFASRVNGELIKIPSMSLYARADDALKLLKVNRDISGVLDEHFKPTVMAIWREVCIRHNVDIDEYCDDDIHISVGVIEGIIYNHTIRDNACRAEVANAVYRISGRHPKHVYCSSTPSYNIVMETDDYFAADIDNIKGTLTAEIKRIAEKHVCEKYSGVSLDDPLNVSFYHPKMPTYNGYGLARQD